MITLNRFDGLHIMVQATLRQLSSDKTILEFADGLLARVFVETGSTTDDTLTLAEAVHQIDSARAMALLTALLVLDAEIHAIVDDEARVWPLAGFISYRSQLPIEKYPLSTLRLPPLNPGGYYEFARIDRDQYLAVRMDIHPDLRITGHVRIAISGPQRQPQRIQAVEQRLDRQQLDKKLIQAAVFTGSDGLSTSLSELERARLQEVLEVLAER